MFNGNAFCVMIRTILLQYFVMALTSAADLPSLPAPPSADGWIGATSTLRLIQANDEAPLVIHGLVPDFKGTPFLPHLTISIDGVRTATAALHPGEFEVRKVVIGKTGAHVVELTLDQVHALSAPDTRIVGAQLWQVAFETLGPVGTSWSLPGATAQQDVVAKGGPIGLGSGWYLCEHWQGQMFRWMSARAELALAPGADMIRLSIDAEPGPAAPPGGAVLRILDADSTFIDKVHLERRGIYDVMLVPPPMSRQPIILAMDSHLPSGEADPRQLCVRIFSITAELVK